MMQNETSTALDKAETHTLRIIYPHTGLGEAWETHGIDELIKRGDEVRDLLEEPTHSLPSFISVHIPLLQYHDQHNRKKQDTLSLKSGRNESDGLLSFFPLSGPPKYVFPSFYKSFSPWAEFSTLAHR